MSDMNDRLGGQVSFIASGRQLRVKGNLRLGRPINFVWRGPVRAPTPHSPAICAERTAQARPTTSAVPSGSINAGHSGHIVRIK